MLGLDPVETGLIVYATITTYWSLLGTYLLIKSDIISLKAAPLLIGYSVFSWAVSRLAYMTFPEIPPHPVLLLSRLVDSPQGILTTVYVYAKTKVLKIKWIPYITLYSFLIAISRATLYLCRSLPIPEILVLPMLLSGWAGYPAWFYLYVKANKVFTPFTALAIIFYEATAWSVIAFMLYSLELPYSIISAVQMLLEYPSTIITLIFIDRYRLGYSNPKPEIIVMREKE